ncbi:MAG: phage recombination protein Bet [Bifidobacterium dentium]|nr:phage recombination protein Bet [Bifidobacterium dentium]
MSSDLVLTKDQNNFTEQQMSALQALGVENAGQGDLMLFLNQAQRTGLDPFSKQIYMIGRRTKVNDQWVTKQTIQVGIDGFRLIARRAADASHERYSAPDILWCDPKGGWHDAWIWDQPPVAAKATIVRGEGQFSAVALYREYVGTRFDKTTGKQVPNSMWSSKPALMLGKCAEALALRKAFPMELSGLYTADEMSQADNMQTVPATVVEDQPVQPTQQMASKAQADAINGLLHDCGVDSTDMAQYVFHAHTGLSGITSATQLSRIDAENLTASKDVLKQRTLQAIEEYRRQHQPEEAAEEKKEA